MVVLETAPPELSTLQRRVLWATAVAVAVTRLWARSKTLWDWDETLFSLAVRDYDVVQHHPHPPGFPVYVALAKAVRLATGSDFHALQFIVIASAVLLFPLCFFLARELRFPFRTAYLGTLLFIFLPNVWFYGGTAFSDVPALALTFAACACLLKGCRSSRAYLLGAILLGVAAAVRPQALMLGCVPALLSTWASIRRSEWRRVIVAIAIGAAIVGLSYAGAALASSSVDGYFETARNLRDYIRKVDSYQSPHRPPLLSLIPQFFVFAIPGGKAIAVIAALAAVAVLISCFRKAPRVWLLLAIFLPFNLFGWLMLDINSISRYSVGYAAMYALLAAEAVASVAVIFGSLAAGIEVLVIVALAARLGFWTVPPLQNVRRTVSPPVAAMRWIRASIPKTATVYVHGSMSPWASYFLPDYHTEPIEDPKDLPNRAVTRDEWLVTEGSTPVADGKNFIRDRNRLFDLVRQRYFEVSVAPLSGMLRFVDGWYGDESVGEAAWRWMSGRSVTQLPPIAGQARLSLGFTLPSEVVPRRPVVTIALNGRVIDQFTCTEGSVQKSWVVPARADGWNELVISIDKVINPQKEGIAQDPRDLGLQLTSYSWGPA